MPSKSGGGAAASTKKPQKVTGTLAHVKATSTTTPGTRDAAHRSGRLRPATVDLSQCHNESLDLVRLIISLHPQHLTEARDKLNHFAMHAGSDGAGYYDRLASLLWTGRAAAKNLESFQRMNMKLGSVATNHFPGVDEMCNKSYLARRLKFMERMHPGQYDFVPKTWVLPNEWDTFRAEVASATAAATSSSSPGPTYIFKPSSGSQGSGIMLAQRLPDMERIYRQSVEDGVSLTVQEYIARPLLLGGLKFDFRIYCLVESLQPLRLHLYKDGLARFCTEEYVEPTLKNLKQSFMHLTNSSLNKTNEEKFKVHSTAELTEQERQAINRGFVEQSASITESKENTSTAASASLPAGFLPPDFNLNSFGFDLKEEECSKRSIRTVLQQLRTEEHRDVQDRAFWASIADIVSKTVIALWAPLIANYKVAFPVHRPTTDFPSACFHILGFDILLDSALKPWLLELNCSPSLNIESTLDLVLKKGMLEKALGILGYLGDERRRKPNTNTTNTRNDEPTSAAAAAARERHDADAEDDKHGARTAPSSSSGSPVPPASGSNGYVPGAMRLPALPHQSQSTPGSGSTTPLPAIGPSSLRSSPLTLSSAPPLHPAMPVTLVPPIPFSSHRRATSSSVPSGVRYVALPGGTIQALEVPRAASAASTPTIKTPTAAAAATPSPSPSPPPLPLPRPSTTPPPIIGHDQETVDYLELCPEEEWSRSHPSSSSSARSHPLLVLQHPKLLGIFDRYTVGSTTKKLSSSKFMQACVACKIATSSGGSSTSSTSTTTLPGVVGRPLANWPSRPDIDLLFLQATKFDAPAGASIGAPSKMLDFAGFADLMVHVAETKYKHLITPANGSAPSMTLLEAFHAFLDSLVLPEEKGGGRDSLASSVSGGGAREQAAKIAAAQLALTVVAPPPSAFLPPAKRLAHSPTANAAGVVTSFSRTLAAPVPLRPAAVSPNDPSYSSSSSSSSSSSALAMTLSSILAPKDPATSVFHRLATLPKGHAAAAALIAANTTTPLSTNAAASSAGIGSIKKKRRAKDAAPAGGGTYEAFIAAYQPNKTTKSKTNKK